MGDVESLKRVKSLVGKIALDAVLAEAQADEFVIVRRAWNFGMEVLVSKPDSEWAQLGEVTTLVRQTLAQSGAFTKHHQLDDGRFCLTTRVPSDCGPVAALLIRNFDFPDDKHRILDRMVRSVLLAGENQGVEEPLMMVDVEPHPHGYRATVSVDVKDRQPAMAIKSDRIVAIATAGTALTESPVWLRFAAQTSLEDGIVSIVLVEADDGGPIFGVSFDRGTAKTGPVAAVFSAASFVNSPALAQV